MAELGGMLAAAILKVVGDQIGSAIGGQITLQRNFEKELKKMKKALESVDAVLEDAGRRSVTDKTTLLWLKRLKDAMYAISDIIDEFEAGTESITQLTARKFSFKKYLAIMIPCLAIGPKITMANKMEKMREDLEVITDQHKKFNLREGTSGNEPHVIDIRETTSAMETQIVGRIEEEKEILASLLESMTEEITILPICGIGGLGKTTLAKMVYNSSQFKQYSQVWVYVSQTFDLKKIGNSILSQLSKEKKESEYATMQMIHNSLEELLADKKILIILDDLWEGAELQFESLMNMLKVKGSSVVVIVTTRDEGIAKKISTIKPYKLAKLTDDMCWSIIKQKSEFESRDDKEQLEEIGKAIAMKCGGVALAAKSLGHMLKSMEFGEWELVRDSNIWTSTKQVLASLKLSYSVMSSYLKLCFAYCAIFPKGHKIAKDDIIHHWVSLGFCTWQHGETYISELLGLSFLEHSRSPSTFKLYDEDITLLTMHDLVHDLARSVMDDEILIVGKCGNSNTEGSYYHYALLDDCSKPLGLESSKIRALRFMDCEKIELHEAAFSSAKSLRVLDLSECSIHKLADCIGGLKQLRYLNTPRVQYTAIPDSISKLSKLVYLNLHGSHTILALPESIGEIEGLMYLDLSGCSGIEKLPESFGGLKELVHLDLSNCSRVGGISVFLGSLTKLQYLNLSYCPNIGMLPEALGDLSKLNYLDLSFCSYLDGCQEAEVLGALTKLEYLNLSSEHSDLQKLPEALGGFIQLKYLNLSGCRGMGELPRLFGNLKCLVHLDLSHCRRITSIDEALVGLTNLQYLNLQFTCVSWLPHDLTKLRYLNLSNVQGMDRCAHLCHLINHIGRYLLDLEHLDLSNNRFDHEEYFWLDSICSLTKLHTLDLSRCFGIFRLPESIGTMSSLRFLYVETVCKELPQVSSSLISLPHFVVQVADGDSSSNLVLLQHTDPIKLQISKLEKVKSAGEAHHVELKQKRSLEDLKLEWTGDVDRFVDDRMLLDKLEPPRTLKVLEICGYNGASFPTWLAGQLPNLGKLILRGMADVVEWNTSYSSGEDHVIKELEIYDCPLLRMKPLPPKAKYWWISNSDNVLSSWEECTVSDTNASSSSSPVTTELSVRHCKVPLHQWRLLQHLPGLSTLSISSSADLTGSPEIIRHLSSVQTLCLEHEDLEELPKWAGELPSLQCLKIEVCRGLKGLNENMRQLTKLRSLLLYHCDSMVSLPHWLGELTSLEYLKLCCCPELKHFAESEKGKMKLTHNQEKICVLPTSLQKLIIDRCEGIKSLPEGMQQLTNLKNLCLIMCPELQQWCELDENRMKLAHISEKEFH